MLAGATQGWDHRVANEACAPHGTLRFREVWKRGISKACSPRSTDARTGLAQGEDKPFAKKLQAWGVTTHHDLPS